MRKPILLLLCAIACFFSIQAQDSTIKKVMYARTLIDVPEGYTSNDKYSIANGNFSAEWLYLKEEWVSQGMQNQILDQFAEQLKYSAFSPISFTSNGSKFSGYKYSLSGNPDFDYRVLAFGTVGGQPLILNLGFKDDPELTTNADALMQRFISIGK